MFSVESGTLRGLVEVQVLYYKWWLPLRSANAFCSLCTIVPLVAISAGPKHCSECGSASIGHITKRMLSAGANGVMHVVAAKLSWLDSSPTFHRITASMSQCADSDIIVDELGPDDSVSRAGSRTSRHSQSSLASIRAKTAAKRASLVAKAQFLEMKQALVFRSKTNNSGLVTYSSNTHQVPAGVL